MEQESSLSLGPSPGKKLKQVNFRTICVICWKKDGDANLVNPKEEGKKKVFDTLVKCADDAFYLVKSSGGFDVDEDGNVCGFSVPIRYHRKCYLNYTSSRNLSFRQTEKGESSKSTETDRPEVKTRTSAAAFDKAKCIFCDCVKKGGDAKLINVSTTDVQKTIHTAASTLGDQDLLTKVLQQDLIALEAKYHSNCLSKCLRKASRTEKAITDTENEDPYTKAFENLLREIEGDIRAGKAFEMSALLAKYKALLQICGVDNSESYRSEKLKKRLKKYFNNELVFHQSSRAKQSELVYSSGVNIRTTINKISDMKRKISEEDIEEDLFSDERDSDSLSLANVAILLRSAIKEVQGINTNPCIDKKDICEAKAKEMIPPVLFRFVAALLGGNLAKDITGDNDDVDKETERRVISLCQDIIYTVRKSRVKTPKHVGLSISVKHLTGSRQVIDMLHSQGHCLSYDDLCRTESAIASATIEVAEQNDGIYIPTNISAGGSFVHAAMDNIDINEETRSGEGTTHVLGSVLYQEKTDGITGTLGHKPQRRTKIRQKSVDSLSCLEILDCPNQYRKTVSMVHLKSKVEPGKWFGPLPGSISLDRTIVFARMCPMKLLSLEFGDRSPSEQYVPSWAGVHAILKFKKEVKTTNLSYNPVIQGLPTEMNTIYTGLKIVEKQTRMLQQEVPVITFDLQLYIIAQEVRLRNWNELSYIVLRLGGFHILELYWKTLGKRFSHSGIKEILTEADVFGPNAMDHVMKGGNYKRCTLAHKLMFETMCRLQLQAFLSWLVSKDQLSEELAEIMETGCQNLQESTSKAVHDKPMTDENCATVKDELRHLQELLQKKEPEFQQFINEGQKASYTFSLWNQYLQDVEIALNYIEAEKTPNWNQHLTCFADICSYAFAYDRHNYARWGPVYLAEMHLLKESAPSVYHEFQRGKHVVTRSAHSSFNSVWSDLGLEQSVVKDTKSKQGGIIGFSRVQQATLKWYLNVHERSGILRNFKEMCDLSEVVDQGHRDLKPPNTRKDESDIQRISQVITDRFGNPFIVSEPGPDNNESPDPLINIATGVVAGSDVAYDMLNAKSIGKQEMTDFVEQRLNKCDIPLASPIKKKKLKTFTNNQQAKVRKSGGKVKSIDSDRELFGRLLIISKDRKLDLEKLFTYELSTVPLALANEDGSLAKTNKAQTLRDIEAYAEASLDADSFMDAQDRNLAETGVFVDYMAVVQVLTARGGIKTFGQLVDEVIKFIRRGFLEGDCVQVISDRYDYDESVKAGERKRRGATMSSPEIKVKSRDQVFPSSLKTFLSNPKNKDNFNNFAFQEMAAVFPGILSEQQHLVLAGGFENHEKVVSVCCNGSEELPELFSTQEEADTRLWLHANDAARRFDIKTAILWSPDTDVLVLGVHLFRDIPVDTIWFKTGTKKSTRYVPVHTITEQLGESLCRLMLPFHAFTGCDSTSCFKWKGKKKGLELLSKDESFMQLEELGNTAELPDSLIDICISFVCRLYKPNGKETDINKLRYQIFCKKPVHNDRLPPCKDSIIQHCKRVNYQCFLWKHALVAHADIPKPSGHGWTASVGILEPVLMTQESAPKEIDELTTCSCKGSRCASGVCVCRRHNLSCTIACSCEGDDDLCENNRGEDDIECSLDDSTSGDES